MTQKRKYSNDEKAESAKSKTYLNESNHGDCKDELVRDDEDDNPRERNKLLKQCNDCLKNLPKNSFIPSSWRGPMSEIRSCKICNAKKLDENKNQTVVANKKKCHQCKELLGKKSFQYFQWKGSPERKRRCIACYKDAIKKEERLCNRCNEVRCKDFFSNVQWKGPNDRLRTCKECVKKEKPKAKPRKKDADITQKDNAADSSKTNEKKKKTFVTDPVLIKQMISERAKPLPNEPEKKHLKFQWESFPISKSDENTIRDALVVEGSYGRISKDEKIALSNLIKKLSSQMTLEQSISLRQVLLQQKAQWRHVIIQKNANYLYKKYKKGSTIMELSYEIDCPPMNIFRSVLTSMNYSKAKIKKCLRNPEKELEEREKREFKEAESADSVSNVDQDKSRKFADAFEDIIAKFLRKNGVSFVRQKQLELEQKKSFGVPMLTPDFLILDAVEVNGKPVTWIDAKAFYGASVAFNYKKTRSQASRYIDHWGCGAFLYLHGFSEQLRVKGCTMLNAQSILSSDDLLSLK